MLERDRIYLLATGALALALAGCGGGSADSAASGLRFRAFWEQSAATDAIAFGATGDSELPHSFGGTIPTAVHTVRVTLVPADPSGPPSCCIAVERGSTTFANRVLTLDGIREGDTVITLRGYPTSYAPADGIARRCPTVPADAGVACDTTRSALPSFSSDSKTVTVVAGETTDAGDFLIYSMPFLTDLDPAPGATVVGPNIAVRAGVVDAINNVTQGDVSVTVAAGTPASPVAFAMQPLVACDERAPGSPTPCTVAADMEVAGYLVDGTSAPVAPGTAQITISATNDATPQRAMVYAYEVNVVAPATTTTTSVPGTSTTTLAAATTTTLATSSTTLSSTSSTTTTSSTTSTTLGASSCVVTFGLTNGAAVAGLTFDVDYSAAPGDFTGSGATVSCTVNPATGAFGAFNDADASRQLRLGVISVADFVGPIDLVDCDFVALPDPVAGDFALSVVESFAADLSAVVSTVGVTNITCTP